MSTMVPTGCKGVCLIAVSVPGEEVSQRICPLISSCPEVSGLVGEAYK